MLALALGKSLDEVGRMTCEEYATWQAYFAEHAFPDVEALDTAAAAAAGICSALTRKTVPAKLFRMRYERPKSLDDHRAKAAGSIGSFVGS